MQKKQSVLRRLKRRAAPLVGAALTKFVSLKKRLISLRPERLLLAGAFALVYTFLLLAPVPGHASASPLTLPYVAVTVALFSLGVVLLVCLGLRFQPQLGVGTRRLSVIGLATTLALLGIRVDRIFAAHAFAGIGAAELLSVTAGAAMVTLLLGAPLAVLWTGIWVALGSLLVAGEPFAVSGASNAASFVSALIAIMTAAKIRSRTDVARAALVLTASNICACASIHMLWSRGPLLPQIGWTTLASLGGVAFFSSAVTLLERPLGLITHLGLLELSDLNRPLLRRFAAEAPGTYAHSIMAGNLAAAAAEAVGADPLLARVAAYYHDLGKMRRASFFVENQEGDNIHERIAPSLSAVVLTAHVREGLQIASEEHLPPAIKDIIVQHHGTSLISYFYHQAAKTDVDLHDLALEHRFRYPGPKPQTKEAAIMMLADGIEAASHTLSRPSRARVEEFVQKMIDCKVADHQLDECPLTLGDLKALKETFVRVLCGMLHSRIEYPETQKEGTQKEGTQKEGTYLHAAPVSLVPALLPVASPKAVPSPEPASEPEAAAIRHETHFVPEPVAPRLRIVARHALTRTGRHRAGATARTPAPKRSDASKSRILEPSNADASSAPGIAGSGSYS